MFSDKVCESVSVLLFDILPSVVSFQQALCSLLLAKVACAPAATLNIQ